MKVQRMLDNLETTEYELGELSGAYTMKTIIFYAIVAWFVGAYLMLSGPEFDKLAPMLVTLLVSLHVGFNVLHAALGLRYGAAYVIRLRYRPLVQPVLVFACLTVALAIECLIVTWLVMSADNEFFQLLGLVNSISLLTLLAKLAFEQ